MAIFIERLEDISPVEILSHIMAREIYPDALITPHLQRQIDRTVSNLIEYRFYDPFDEMLSDLECLLTDEVEMAMAALAMSFFRYPRMVKRLEPDVANRVVIIHFED